VGGKPKGPVTKNTERSILSKTQATFYMIKYYDTDHNFKWKHYEGFIILLCMRWYCKYALSYRDLEEMMAERGLSVVHTTIYRWVYQYASMFEKKMRWYQGYRGSSWRVDETYIKVKGKWCYLYRAIDKYGNMIDFMLSRKRDTESAKRFFRKAIKNSKYYEPYARINTDQYSAYIKAISDLQDEGVIPRDTEHSQIKYLNNIIESDHFRLKKAMKIIHGFKSFASAARTIKGMECMLMLKKRQFITMKEGILGEVEFVNKLFGIHQVNCA